MIIKITLYITMEALANYFNSSNKRRLVIIDANDIRVRRLLMKEFQEHEQNTKNEDNNDNKEESMVVKLRKQWKAMKAILVVFTVKSTYSNILAQYFNQYYEEDYRIVYGHQNLAFFLSPLICVGTIGIIFTNSTNFINREIMNSLKSPNGSRWCLKILSSDYLQKLNLSSYFEHMVKLPEANVSKLLNFGVESSNIFTFVHENRQQSDDIQKLIEKFEGLSETRIDDSVKTRSTASTIDVNSVYTYFTDWYEKFVEKLLKKHKSGESKYNSFIKDSETKFSQHVSKFMKENDLEASPQRIKDFFVYWIIKMKQKGIIDGYLVSKILNEGITNYDDIFKLDSVIIDTSVFEAESTTTASSVKTKKITKYNKDFEAEHKEELALASAHILNKFSSKFYKDKYNKITNYPKLRNTLSNIWKYYALTKEIPKEASEVVRAYKYFPDRIIDVLINKNVVLRKEGNAIESNEDGLEKLHRELVQNLESPSELFSHYFLLGAR